MISIQPGKGQRPLAPHVRITPEGGSHPYLVVWYGRDSVQGRLTLHSPDMPTEAPADALLDGADADTERHLI